MEYNSSTVYLSKKDYFPVPISVSFVTIFFVIRLQLLSETSTYYHHVFSIYLVINGNLDVEHEILLA